MPTERFSVRGTPKAIARKALAIMKRAKIPQYKLQECSVTQRGDSYVASARWDDDGIIFLSSAELRVEAKKPYSGKGSDVEICSDGDPCTRLAERLRRGL